jgi:AcrR family transcriptional regulator
VAETWLPQIDARVHDTTGQPPLALWEQERAHLVPLPAHAYDTAAVVYRVVGPEWHIPFKQNCYSVPWSHIGLALPVRITETELVVYGPGLTEVTRHTLEPPGAGRRVTQAAHAPGRDEPRRHEQLVERFRDLGPDGPPFLEALVRTRRYGKDEAHRVLALLATYARADLVAALARACRYRACSLTAVERILAAQAQPKAPLLALAEDAAAALTGVIGHDPVPPRSTAEYAPLLKADDGPKDHEPT